jgi:uncharacterized membrane protein
MNAYALLKTLHIVSALILVGTGFGTAYYFYFANRSGNVQGAGRRCRAGGAGGLVVHDAGGHRAAAASCCG